MFGDDLVIGSIRAQASHLRQIVDQIEADQNWREHCAYFAKEMHDIERDLRRIRSVDLKLIYSSNPMH